MGVGATPQALQVRGHNGNATQPAVTAVARLYGSVRMQQQRGDCHDLGQLSIDDIGILHPPIRRSLRSFEGHRGPATIRQPGTVSSAASPGGRWRRTVTAWR